jgi:glutamyl-tRNA synthetase/glutamyl-Q tRNA(Asp) synthetase
MPRTRFAPAPTGYLHLGHVANALAVWGVAQARGAAVVLRIEDHDRQRCRPEYEAALLDDLEWLGLAPDVGAVAEFRRGASDYRQSDNDATYQAAVDRLGSLVYACDCSRKTEESGRPYSGRCRERGLPVGPGRGLRVQLPDVEERFTDLRLGAQAQRPVSQCGDLLLRDRLGNWTYQFAVVVDDLRQAIDLIVRGEDLLDSTGRQLALARLLGAATMPTFLHHRLLLKPNGAKLSKSDGDTGVRELRAAGATPELVLGQAVHALGLIPEPHALTLAEARTLVGVALTTQRG